MAAGPASPLWTDWPHPPPSRGVHPLHPLQRCPATTWQGSYPLHLPLQTVTHPLHLLPLTTDRPSRRRHVCQNVSPILPCHHRYPLVTGPSCLLLLKRV